MMVWDLRSAFFVVAAAALLQGCGGPQVAGTQAALSSAGAHLPVKAPVPKMLLYVSDVETATVHFYDYPDPKQSIGELTGFGAPMGLCSDASGNVWITDSKNQNVVEYAQGGTSEIGSVSDSGYAPYACAVDATTGNLAVSSHGASGSAGGNVAVYAGASGTPTTYTDPEIETYYFCSYDKNGNLFVDGDTKSGKTKMDELPAGGSSLESLSSSQPLPKAGSFTLNLDRVGITTFVIGPRDRGGLNYIPVEYFNLANNEMKFQYSENLFKIDRLEQLWHARPRLFAVDGVENGKALIYDSFHPSYPRKELPETTPFGIALSIAQ